MKTIFTVFLLLPMTTGLRSFACSGTSDEGVEHNLYCEAGERISIIAGQYMYTNSSESCNRDYKYQSRQFDCPLGFFPTVERYLTNLCNGKKTCNFRSPTEYFGGCYRTTDNGRTTYNHYTYSYIHYECLTGVRWYSCSEPNGEHHIYCEEGERLSIITGFYGFRYESCSDRCQHSDSCECFLDFNSTVEWNLKDSCNQMKICNFKPARPHNKRCYNNYTNSYIVFGCLAVTTTLSARTTSTTRDQGTHDLTGQVYTDTSTITSTQLDNSKPLGSTDKARSESTEAALYTTDITNAKAVNHNQDTPGTAVIAGSVTGCIILVILVIIVVVVILTRKRGACYKENDTSNPAYETPTAFKTDASLYANLTTSHHHSRIGDQPIYENVSRLD